MAGRRPLFDKKFGDEFIAGLPTSSGVYEILDEAGAVIYVGKARNLRKRLQQYRNARRRKKSLKMREIIAAAHSIRTTACPGHLDAVLLENRLIQSLRPPFNVAGAFSFLYPCIGLERRGHDLYLCYTTSPEAFTGFSFNGAYRSRDTVKAGFLSLLDLLEYMGHREPRSRLAPQPKVRVSIVAAFRQISHEHSAELESFLRGESRKFLETAVLTLVDKPSARRRVDETQEMLDNLARFYRFEAMPLRKACADLGIKGPFVPQIERDRLFLIAAEARKAKQSATKRPKANRASERSA